MAELQNLIDKNYILNPILRLIPRITMSKLVNPLNLTAQASSDFVPLTLKTLTRGQPLFHENDPVDDNSEAFFIISGKVIAKANNREFENDVSKGVVGEMALLTSLNRSATCYVDGLKASFYVMKKKAFNLLFYMKQSMMGFNLRNAMLEVLLRKFDEQLQFYKDDELYLDAFITEHDFFIGQKFKLEVLSYKMTQANEQDLFESYKTQFQNGINKLVQIILKHN